MSATAVLEDLRRLGVSITINGDKLRLKPAKALDDEMLDRVRQHKAEIMGLLQNPVAAPIEVLPALEAEEPLYRLWWRTLPDKALARRMDGHLAYWGRERGLSAEALDWLRGRVRDLLTARLA